VGHINFAPNAHAFDAHNGSHAVAPVVSKSHTSFVFPVGDQGVYQPMMITEGSADELTVKFNLRAFSNTQPNRAIEQISNRFYWAVDGDKEALLSLTWNSFSELTFLTDELAALVMVGYNGTDWEVIPAIVDPFNLDGNSPTSLREGSIRSIDPVRFSRFEALSLDSVVLDTSLKVSESKKDFQHKLSIAYKEARETHYWLQLLKDADFLDKEIATNFLVECDELLRILGSILKTIKN